MDIEKIALNFSNILLKSQKCSVNSRSECDISTEIAGKKINSPIFCANMVSILTPDICKIFDDNGWFHIYHRINGNNDITVHIYSVLDIISGKYKTIGNVPFLIQLALDYGMGVYSPKEVVVNY